MLILKIIFLTHFLKISLANIFVDSFEEDDLNELRRSNDLYNRDMLLVVIPNDPDLRTKMSIKSELNQESKPVKTERDFDDDIGIADLKLTKKQEELLRKRWNSSCDKKAAKTCTKACKATLKIVCGSFKCRKGMKKSFRKECKRNCKAKFVSSKYSDSE